MLTTTLGPDDAPRAARRAVAACCTRAGAGKTCSDSAELMTSEVVTNAMLHSNGPVTFGVECGGPLLRVEVGDDDARRPSVPEQDETAESGRGMRIVQALSSAWGVQTTPTGKLVWFEVATHP